MDRGPLQGTRVGRVRTGDLTIDHAQHLARYVVTRAIEDECDHRGGTCALTDTMAVFLEHRFAEVLRAHMPKNEETRRRFDA